MVYKRKGILEIKTYNRKRSGDYFGWTPACQELKIKPVISVETFDGDGDLQEKLFVIESNLRRRQLAIIIFAFGHQNYSIDDYDGFVFSFLLSFE